MELNLQKRYLQDLYIHCIPKKRPQNMEIRLAQYIVFLHLFDINYEKPNLQSFMCVFKYWF